MRFKKYLFLIVVCLFLFNLSAEENNKESKKYSLIYAIPTLDSLFDAYNGTMFAFKVNFHKHAVRVGLDIFYDYRDFKTEETEIDFENYDEKTQRIGQVENLVFSPFIDYMYYLNNKSLSPYIGCGLFGEYMNESIEVVNLEDAGYQTNDNTLETYHSLGAKLFIGAEWRFSEWFSLFLENGVKGSCRMGEKESESYYNGELIETEFDEYTYFRISSINVTLGLLINF